MIHLLTSLSFIFKKVYVSVEVFLIELIKFYKFLKIIGPNLSILQIE